METVEFYRSQLESINVTETIENLIRPAPITTAGQVSVAISENDMKNLRDRIRFIKSLSESDPMMVAFKEKAKNLRQSVDPVTGDLIIIPSEFICAPSGTGKTTFVHRICCGETPCLYGLFHYSRYRS